VRKNAGAAGRDKMTVRAFERWEKELLELIHEKLTASACFFNPTRRVLIPKERNSKKQKLGISVVMDRRIVSKSVNLILKGNFDPTICREEVTSTATPYPD